MPKIVDRDVQCRTIRHAARRVFAKRGVDTAGLVHVARAAGVGRATLYHYYPDKAALVRDVVRELLLEEEKLVRAALTGHQGGPLERIERLSGQLSDLSCEWAPLSRMLFDLWSTTASLFRPFFRKVRRDLGELIVEGQHEGEIASELDPSEAAVSVIALIDGMLLQNMVDNAVFSDPIATKHLVVAVVRKILVP